MSWARANWRWLLAMGLLIAGSAAAIVLVIFLQKRKAERLVAKLRLSEAKAAVKALEARRRERSGELNANAIEAARLEKRILAAKRRAVSALRDTSKMTPAQIAEAYRAILRAPKRDG